MNINTLLVQTGVKVDQQFGSISVPIYQNATYQHPDIGQNKGFDYSRTGNPTRKALEDGIALLEGGTLGLAFSSGMAAITSVLMLFESGDHIIVSDDLYGGTYRLFEQIFIKYNITATYVNTSEADQVKAAIQPKTKAVFIETPTNPLMKISDIRGITEIAKANDLLTIVDNTFMTPYLQKPLVLGSDIVIHSGTKYLGGHNDLVAGLVVTKDKELGQKIKFIQNSAGAILGPQDSWLLIRGIKTLGIRMDRIQENAIQIANWLLNQGWVTKVYYPGLGDHPGRVLAQTQATGFGGMLSFEVTSFELAQKILRGVKLITFAESLGGVETLLTHPACMTHGDIPEETREKLGINNCLLRLSVGIEDVFDIINDLYQAADV